MKCIRDKLPFVFKGDQASMLFNQGELEECDSLPEDVLYIVRMNIKDGNITQKVSIFESLFLIVYNSLTIFYFLFLTYFLYFISDQSLYSPMVVYKNNKPK